MNSRRTDLPFVLTVTALCLLATSLPYLSMWRHTPPDQWFGGIVYNAHDQNVYFMWMRQAAEGGLLGRNLMTFEPHQPFFFNSFWLALGRLSREVDPTWVYQSTRLVLIAVFVPLLWGLLGALLTDLWPRRAALLIILFGGGLAHLFGALNLVWAGGTPAGTSALIMPELLTWQALCLYPHFVAALCLLVGIFHLALRALRSAGPAWRETAAAAFLTALLASFHLYDVVVVAAVVVLYPVLRWRGGQGQVTPPGKCLLILAPGLLVAGAVTLGIAGSPAGRAWSAGNVMPTPSPFALGVALGLPLLLALWNHRRLLHWHEMTAEQAFVAAWVIGTVLVAFTDTIIPFERRLLLGFQIPVTVLAVQTWADHVLPAWQRWRQARGDHGLLPPTLAWGLLVLLTLPQTVSTGMFLAGKGRPHEEYINRDLRTLCGQLPPDSRTAVLCSGATGNWLPRLAGRAVYVGHRDLTPRAAERSAAVEWFFGKQADDPWRRKLLRVCGCGALLACGSEREALVGLLGRGDLKRRATAGDCTYYEIAKH